MSDYTTKLQNSNELFVDYDTKKFLLGFNSFIEGMFTAGGSDITLTQGQIMGQIASTGKIVPMKSTAIDGSQFPYGLIITNQVVAASTTVSLMLVNKGRVSENITSFDGTDDMTTSIGVTDYLRTYRAYLNDLGLIFETGVENTAVDNS